MDWKNSISKHRDTNQKNSHNNNFFWKRFFEVVLKQISFNLLSVTRARELKSFTRIIYTTNTSRILI